MHFANCAMLCACKLLEKAEDGRRQRSGEKGRLLAKQRR